MEKQKKVMVYGVIRSDGRGVPKCIIQKEMTRKEEWKNCVHGTLKIAHLHSDSTIDVCWHYLTLIPSLLVWWTMTSIVLNRSKKERRRKF